MRDGSGASELGCGRASDAAVTFVVVGTSRLVAEDSSICSRVASFSRFSPNLIRSRLLEGDTEPGANRVLHVAFLGGEPVGCCSSTLRLPYGTGSGHWGALAVHPDARGRGVASALVAAAERRLLDHGCTEVQVEYKYEQGAPESERLREWLEGKLGFRGSGLGFRFASKKLSARSVARVGSVGDRGRVERDVLERAELEHDLRCQGMSENVLRAFASQPQDDDYWLHERPYSTKAFGRPDIGAASKPREFTSVTPTVVPRRRTAGDEALLISGIVRKAVEQPRRRTTGDSAISAGTNLMMRHAVLPDWLRDTRPRRRQALAAGAAEDDVGAAPAPRRKSFDFLSQAMAAYQQTVGAVRRSAAA